MATMAATLLRAARDASRAAAAAATRATVMSPRSARAGAIAAAASRAAAMAARSARAAAVAIAAARAARLDSGVISPLKSCRPCDDGSTKPRDDGGAACLDTGVISPLKSCRNCDHGSTKPRDDGKKLRAPRAHRRSHNSSIADYYARCSDIRNQQQGRFTMKGKEDLHMLHVQIHHRSYHDVEIVLTVMI